MTEQEFKKEVEGGNVEVVQEELEFVLPETDPITTEKTLEDYVPFLEKLRQFQRQRSSTPTETPRVLLDQVVHYHSGSTYRVYMFIKDAWKKIYDSAVAVVAHATSHENGGSDEISVAGLSGELADPQPPKSHSLSAHTDPTGTIGFANNKLIEILDPTQNQGAATKKYVDDRVGGFGTIANAIVDNAGHQVSKDSIIYGFMASAGGAPSLKAYTDSNATPSTLIVDVRGNSGAAFSFPVKKNNYYRLTAGGGASITAKIIPV